MNLHPAEVANESTAIDINELNNEKLNNKET